MAGIAERREEVQTWFDDVMRWDGMGWDGMGWDGASQERKLEKREEIKCPENVM